MQVLRLDGNKIGDAGMSALASACANGALAALEKLYLHDNQIGDNGMQALAGAVSKGALPKCANLLLPGNPGSGEPVKKALGERKK